MTESTAIELSTITEIVRNPFIATFMPSTDDLDVLSSYAVISTLGSLFVVMFAGLVLIWQKRDYFHKDHEKYAAELSAKAAAKEHHASRSIQGFFQSVFTDNDSSAPWYFVYLRQLRLRHSLMVFFPHEHAAFTTVSVQWMTAFSKMLTVVFQATVMIRIFFPDDDTCSKYESESDCLDPMVMGDDFMHACEWNSENFSCVFHRPELSVPLVAILCCAVTVAATLQMGIIMQLVELLAGRSPFTALQAGHSGKSQQGSQDSKGDIMDGLISYLLPQQTDELATSQTFRSTMFKAARLQKQLTGIDEILPTEERDLLMATMRQKAVRWETDNAFRKYHQRMTIDRLWYGMRPFTAARVLKTIEDVRHEVIFMKRIIDDEHLPVEERELLLVKAYLLHSFEGYRRNIVMMRFAEQADAEAEATDAADHQVHYHLYMGIYLLYMMGMVVGGYWLGLDIGQRAVKMWLTIFFVALLQELFFIELWVIATKVLVLNRWMLQDFQVILQALKKRCKLLLMRTGGSMKNALDLVQHFNPACRVARNHPHWPVSRLLFSINDIDLPLGPPIDYPLWHRGQHLCMAVLFAFTYVSPRLQAIYLSVLAALTVNGLAWALYELGKVSLAAGVAVAVLLVVGTVAPLLVHNIVDHQKRSADEAKKNIDIFSQLDMEVEMKLVTKRPPSARPLSAVVDNTQPRMPFSNSPHSRPVSALPSRPQSALASARVELEMDDAVIVSWEGETKGSERLRPVSAKWRDGGPPSSSKGNALAQSLRPPLAQLQGPPLPYSTTRVSGPPIHTAADVDPDYFRFDGGPIGAAGRLRRRYEEDEEDEQSDDDDGFEPIYTKKEDHPELFDCQRRMRRITRERQQLYAQANASGGQGQGVGGAARLQRHQQLQAREKVYASTLRQRMRRNHPPQDDGLRKADGPGVRSHALDEEAEAATAAAATDLHLGMNMSRLDLPDESVTLFRNLYGEEDEATRSPQEASGRSSGGGGGGPGAILAEEQQSKKRRNDFPMFVY